MSDSVSLQKHFDNGLDINITDKKNSTLLHYAAWIKNYRMIKFLVQHGAKLDIQEKNKYTPLLISTGGSTLNDDSISIYLINSGANVNIVGIYGSTALRHSVFENKFQIFKLLISKGADFNFFCAECCNRTVFLNACMDDETIEFVRLLLDKGININQVDCNGMNGLIYAVRNRSPKVAELLIARGINISHKDKKDKSAKDYALKTKVLDLIKLFDTQELKN